MLRIALLPLLISLWMTLSGQDSAPKNDPPASQPAAAQTSSATQPATSESFPRNPTQAKILEGLLREQERDRVQPILSEGGPDAGNEGGNASGRPSLLTDGARVYEKLGRLVVAEGRTEFHFSAGGLGKDIRTTMAFNKNQLLEMMEREAESGVVEFIITADVSRYRGENYLTLLKYRRQITHGNLTP